jgi:DegV family protein with EDD domain
MIFKKIRFVTDSTCDIPSEWIEKYRVGIVPAFVNYGGSSYADDGVELIREEYYNKLSSMRPFPTTSAPPPGLAEKVIKEAFEDADHLFILTASAKLSGIYNAMRLGASSLPQDRVTLIDSHTTTMGLGWQVWIGAETAAKTGDVQQAQEAILRVREAQRVFAALGTLEFLHRSGRVGWAAAGIGTLLQIKPVIEVKDGEVESIARVRTFGRAIDELIRLAHESAPLDRLAILYVSDMEAAQQLRAQLQDIAPPDTIFTRVCPAIGTHIGPSGLGLSPVQQSWRT